MVQKKKKRYTEEIKKQIVELYDLGTSARKLGDEYICLLFVKYNIAKIFNI